MTVSTWPRALPGQLAAIQLVLLGLAPALCPIPGCSCRRHVAYAVLVDVGVVSTMPPGPGPDLIVVTPCHWAMRSTSSFGLAAGRPR